MVTRKIHLKGKSSPQGCVSTADKELGLRNCLVSFTTVGKQAKDSKDKNQFPFLLYLCTKSCPDCQVIQQSMEQKL